MTNDRTELAQLLSIAMDGGDSTSLSKHDLEALDRLKQVISTLSSDAADPVPANLIERAKALEARLPRPVSWFDRAIASVMAPLLDSLQQPQAGLRGHELRQCTFEVDGYRLDLEIEQPGRSDDHDEPGSVKVRGQLDSEIEVAFPIRLAVLRQGSDASVVTLDTNEEGCFDFEAPRGTYELAFEISEGHQMVGSVELP